MDRAPNWPPAAPVSTFYRPREGPLGPPPPKTRSRPIFGCRILQLTASSGQAKAAAAGKESPHTPVQVQSHQILLAANFCPVPVVPDWPLLGRVVPNNFFFLSSSPFPSSAPSLDPCPPASPAFLGTRPPRPPQPARRKKKKKKETPGPSLTASPLRYTAGKAVSHLGTISSLPSNLSQALSPCEDYGIADHQTWLLLLRPISLPAMPPKWFC